METSSTSFLELIKDLQYRLDKQSEVNTKLWWEKYMRNTSLFRGTNLIRIRQELFNWYKEKNIDELSIDDKIDIIFVLFGERYSEDKIAGILFLEEYIIPQNLPSWQILLKRFEILFEKGWINDWNVCDWFCIRVLGKLIINHGKDCAICISKWSKSQNLWQARGSVVSFANFAKTKNQNKHFEEMVELILSSCSILIKREERFAKTAVGWILRELSIIYKKEVLLFIERYVDYFSKESLKNATSKMDIDHKEKRK